VNRGKIQLLEYVKGNVSLDDIKMKVEGDYFCAEVYRSDLYKGVFSNINFSPKKFENIVTLRFKDNIKMWVR
jgi:hypothetical protein